MRDSLFNIIEEKMKKNKNKIIYLNEIKKRMQNILDTKYTEQKLYKTIHQMKKS
jgi:hypothetical protein